MNPGRLVVGEGMAQVDPDPDIGVWQVRDPVHDRTGAIHYIPREAFVHLADLEGHCLCGPEVVIIERDFDYQVPFYTHQALSEIYYDDPPCEPDDGDPDDGPGEPPEPDNQIL